ncbi:MAG: DUF1592 domain-containing protein [Acidobacteriota bacterium]
MRRAILAVSVLVASAVAFRGQTPAPAAPDRAMLNQYCIGCHSERLKTGNLVLEKLDPSSPAGQVDVWEKVVRKVRAGMMPPAGAPRPDRTVLDAFAGRLEGALDRESAAHPNPGSIALHRLNRAEYSNVVRDLLGLEIDVTTMLPADDSSEGFDNIADALRISPALLEGYVTAAANISRLAVGDSGIGAVTATYRAPSGFSQSSHIDGLPLGTVGGMQARHTFPLDAEYTIRVGGRGGGGGIGAPARDSAEYVELTLDGERVKVFEVGGRGGTEIKMPVKAGPHTVAAAVLPGSSPGINELWKGAGGGPGVSNIVIVGPVNPTGPGESPSRQKIFSCKPAAAPEEAACARKILSDLALHAYRHPPTEAEMGTLLQFYTTARTAGTFDSGIQRALARILADPQFIYRFEREPAAVKAGESYRINDLELAARLSFFLWSSAPDDELLQVAIGGKLHEPAVLRAQTQRLLRDPKSKALVTNFAGQWLMLRDLKAATPDTRGFDENLRRAMARETETFFESIIREDRSIRDLLDADYTFVDERLARHYGMTGIRGDRFRRVTLPKNDPRRGLLGKASLLLVTSVTNRTSPVARGKWILENILGVSAPLPPPNIPALEEQDKAGKEPGSIREKMELHRSNPACASCHKIMDPIGFSLENFDLVGRWRTVDGKAPINATGQLVDGTQLNGPDTLRAALLSRFDVVARTLSEKLLTYGIGRAMRPADMPSVRAITRDAAKDDYKFSTLILGVVSSDTFQMRRKAAAN